MGNERDEKFAGEEGEYHFSDDQANYDMEPEGETETPRAEPAAASTKENVLAKLTPMRRMIIGVVVFLVLIYIVFKMLTPAQTTPPTEFTQTTPPPAAAPSAPIPVARTTTAPSPTPPPATVAPTLPPAATPTPQPPVMTNASSLPVMQTSTPPASAPTTMAPMPPMPPTPSASTAPPTAQPSMTAPMPPPTVVTSQPPTMPPTTTTETIVTDQNKSMVERLAALEEQNAKLLSLMQTQYAQKITDYEAQNNAMQEKVRTLNKRLANMEASLNKLAQIMQSGDQGTAPVMGNRMPANLPPTKTIEPKMIYSVQAIIPGRAWLKSDSGDTVTVAEGDLLKDYGKVIKIDPYDGIVEIDSGSKIIDLAYGNGGD